MQGKNSTKPRAVRTAEAAQRALENALNKIDEAQASLGHAVERLRARNEQLKAYLEGGGSDPVERVANSPDVPLEDATARAKRYFDALEAKQRRRSSVPPPPSKKR